MYIPEVFNQYLASNGSPCPRTAGWEFGICFGICSQAIFFESREKKVGMLLANNGLVLEMGY